MNDIGVHVALFVLVGAGIVTLAAFYADVEDRAAFRSVPRRFGMFVLGCGILAGLVVLAQHTVASVR